MLTPEHAAIEYLDRAAWRGGTFRFALFSLQHMSGAQTSHLLPTYARVDLAFERGEGAWLVATNGERYLDFTSGVAVNALGHGHPHLVEAITAQAKKVWHVSNLYRIPESERLGERQAGTLPHDHLRGRLPRPHARDARGRRPEEISRRLRSRGRGLRPAAVRRPRGDQAGDRARDRGDPDRADHGRGGRAGGAARVPAGAAAAVRRERAAPGVRRGADRRRTHRRAVRLP